MVLANRTNLKNSRSLLRAFGGLNETYGCTEAEYASVRNFSARNFPALSTRTPRRKLRSLAGLNGMIHLNGLVTVCGQDLAYTPDGAAEPSVTLTGVLADSKKTLAGIGTKVIIFPDKMAFDTAAGTLEPLGAAWEAGESDTVTFAPCDAEGNTYTPDKCDATEPETPLDGQVFLKIANLTQPWHSDSTLEVYSEASGNWSVISLDYCLISATGIGAGFKQWDTVTLSGAGTAKSGQWGGLNGELIVYDVGDDWLRVKAEPAGKRFYGQLQQTGAVAYWTSLDGNAAKRYSGCGTVRVERRVPDLDYLTECDNRLWGCSSAENVIYGCKLGDATNWFSYRGIAADSYAVTVGSDGPFTGAATCMGYVLFFKENTLHKLYGSKPSDFQLTAMRCRGVAKNAARSLRVLNETLYYLSPDGVMAWDGSIPTKVSTALDSSKLANVSGAVGGALDGRYYLHIVRKAGETQQARLLVYDTERGLWHEENVCSQDMASTGVQLYLWDGEWLWAADPSREADWQSTDGVEQGVSFELVTGDVGLDCAEERTLSRLTLRLDADAASTVTVAVSYDCGEWETLRTFSAQDKRESCDIAFVPRRHGTLRLRLTGSGQITLRSIARTLTNTKGNIIQEV